MRSLLALSLAALLSACQQSGGVGPPAPWGADFQPPRFSVMEAPTEYPFASAEEAIVAGINDYRARHGVGPLVETDVLRQFSRAHAEDMVARNYFSHITPEGKGPYQRLLAAGIPFAYYGATNSFASVAASAVIADWDMHPGKKYMLDERFTRVGVGVAGPAANGRYRVTATYIRPKLASAP
jgi:uncharacterized protein YkwD